MTKKRNLEVLQSEKHSDMKIVCGTKTFPAHKAIVCPQSEYFDKACSGPYREASGEFKFPDKDPAVMEKVLEFLYKGEYTFPAKAKNPQNHVSTSGPLAKRAKLGARTASVATTNANTASSKTIEEDSSSVAVGPKGVLVHADILAEADYFMIPKLKMLAMERFHEIFHPHNRHYFAETIKAIYSSPADYTKLKTMLVKQMLEHPWKISHHVDDKLVKSVPDFGVDLFAGIMKRIKDHKMKLETVFNDPTKN